MGDNFIIRNGLIIDGAGGKPYSGDILIQNGIIMEVGRVPESANESRIVIDAAGGCVTPGFIDAHRHSDYAALRAGFGDIELAQGITTVISGACGLTPYPFAPELQQTLAPCQGPENGRWDGYAAYADSFNGRSLPVNVGAMVGSCTIRAYLKGFDPSLYTSDELARAKSMIADALDAGAFGLSMGIMYIPEFYSTINELADIASAARGRVLTMHVRGEGDSLVESIREATRIAEQSGTPLVVSHFKSCGAKNWGKAIYEAIAIIEKTHKNNDVSAEFYPYTGSSTTLLTLIPPGFDVGEGPDALKTALSKDYTGWDNFIATLGFERIILNALAQPENAGYNGRAIAEICESEGCDPHAFICDIMRCEAGSVGIINMSMSQDDVDAVSRLPYAYLISDALYPENIATAHPRTFSAFPKFLRDGVRERGVLPIETAIHKMTAQPAQTIGIDNRGLLKAGYAADINIFELTNVKDNADFNRSGLLASGMDYVFINGNIAWCDGKRAGDYGVFMRR